ncbi:MAG: glycosyltransferase family 4 protein [Thermodesulfobacteriota bacterium]
MNKTKILRIIARLNIGGPAIHTILLTANLNNERYDSILVKGKEGPDEGDMLSLARGKEVEPVFIHELQREISPVKDCIALWRLYRLMRVKSPDIVHTHTAKAGTIGRIAAWLAGVPIILHTFHGHVLEGYFGGVKTRIFILIERVMAIISTRVITLSEGLKRELIKLKVAPEEKIEVIPLGLELKRFIEVDTLRDSFKRSIGLSVDSLLVGIVGRLVPIKAHKYFLEAVREIQKMGGLSPQGIKFIIIGDGELRGELERYTKELGIEDSVVFTGFRSDLPEIYADLDIVVLSSMNEGTPVSLIEAMASARPVVSTKVGGVADLVEDGKTGLLVEPGDSTGLARAISELLRDNEKRKSMGKEGRKRVYPEYDIENLVRRINLLYTALVA